MLEENLETQRRVRKSGRKNPKKKIIFISAIAVLLLAVIVLSAVSVSMYNANTILRNVSVAGVPLGGLTAEQAKLALENHFLEQPGTLTVSIDGDKNELVLSEIDLRYDFEKSASLAYQYGRRGFKLGTLFSSMGAEKKLPVKFSYSREKFNDLILKWTQTEGTNKYTYTIDDDQLIITNGISKLAVNEDAANEALSKALSLGAFDEVLLSKKLLSPQKVDIDAIYDEICGDPVDASYHTVDGKFEYIPEKNGIQFDKKTAKELAESNSGEGKSFIVSLTVEKAAVTVADLDAKLFSDVLSEYSSSFKTSTQNRADNVALAASKMNGTVLAPGQTFSYNDIVGPRTVEAGFKTAGAYLNGKVVDDVGGGICQVSSTLYNAALLANMDITQRLCHQLTVSYVPIGRDATVAYGSIDFKFKNSFDFPVKISATTSGRTLTIRVLGVKPADMPQVTLSTSGPQVIPYKTTETENKALAPGERKVVQKGVNGYYVELYKKVVKNGQVIFDGLESTSKYMATEEIVEVGPPAPDVPASGTPGDPGTDASPSPKTSPKVTPNAAAVAPSVGPDELL